MLKMVVQLIMLKEFFNTLKISYFFYVMEIEKFYFFREELNLVFKNLLIWESKEISYIYY